MNLTPAEEIEKPINWTLFLSTVNPDCMTSRLNFIRQIQADALRAAAKEVPPGWIGRQHLEDLANQLHPLREEPTKS